MSLQDKLVLDLQEAMKRGDEVRRSVLRLIRAEIHNQEIERQRPLDDAAAVKVVSQQAQRHRDSIELFRRGGRPDLVSNEEAELAVLLEYLPRMMSREEIEVAAREVIRRVGAQGPRDLGRVMGPLMAELRGRAEGKEVSAVVSQLLAQQGSSQQVPP